VVALIPCDWGLRHGRQHARDDLNIAARGSLSNMVSAA
jgi:hypothetical protein